MALRLTCPLQVASPLQLLIPYSCLSLSYFSLAVTIYLYNPYSYLPLTVTYPLRLPIPYSYLTLTATYPTVLYRDLSLFPMALQLP